MEKEILNFSDDYTLCKSPKAKEQHAENILKNYEEQYKDIDLHDYSTHKDTKQEYIKRIDKSLESALKECPHIKADYPKMCKRAESLVKSLNKEQNKGIERC